MAYDVIVVGAGHNGLAAAIRLAAKGRRVLVVEGHDQPGGTIKTRELTLPGFRHDVAAMNLSLFAASAFFQEHKSALVEQGLVFVRADNSFGSIFRDGTFIGVRSPIEKTMESIAAVSPADAKAWQKLVGEFRQDGPYLRALLGEPMPSWGAVKAVLKAWRERGAGWLFETFKLLVATPRDFICTRFEHPKVQALLAVWGMHTDFPPDAAGGAMLCYFQSLAAQSFGIAFGQGGSDNIVKAMVGALKREGGELILGDKVTRIEVSNGVATGVTLASGRRLEARTIIANVNPKLVFRDLVPQDPARAVYDRAIAGIRPGPSTLMMHLAMDDRVPWQAEGARDVAYVHLAPDLEMMSRAFAEASAGLLPVEPVIVVGQPTTVDASRAPAGKHVLWVQARVVPARIRGDAARQITETDWARAKDAYADRMLDIIESYAPGFKSRVLGRSVLSPLDIERENPNLIGGDSLAGSHHLDQNFFMRPVAGWSRYRTPVRNLYLCGASTWPGAGTNAGSGFMLAKMLAG